MIRAIIAAAVLAAYASNPASGNEAAVAFLKSVEGYSSTAYRCPGGQITIGYGFADAELVARKDMTRHEAGRILAMKVSRIAADVRRLVGRRRLTQGQEAALISIAYNVGMGKFARSRLLLLVRNGRPVAEIRAEILRWRYITNGGRRRVCVGLYARRKREAAMFR